MNGTERIEPNRRKSSAGTHFLDSLLLMEGMSCILYACSQLYLVAARLSGSMMVSTNQLTLRLDWDGQLSVGRYITSVCD